MHRRNFCVKSRIDYIAEMAVAIDRMKAEGRPIDGVVRHVNSLLAIYPHKDTYIDLHEVFLKEAEQPILPLYITKKEVYMLQEYGRVPETNTKIYRQLSKEFDSQNN